MSTMGTYLSALTLRNQLSDNGMTIVDLVTLIESFVMIRFKENDIIYVQDNAGVWRMSHVLATENDDMLIHHIEWHYDYDQHNPIREWIHMNNDNVRPYPRTPRQLNCVRQGNIDSTEFMIVIIYIHNGEILNITKGPLVEVKHVPDTTMVKYTVKENDNIVQVRASLPPRGYVTHYDYNNITYVCTRFALRY